MINPTPTTPADTAITPLNSLALIEVSGNDAQTFLQGQFSNDIAAIGNTKDCQLNAYCNPKGRVLAVIKVMRHAGGFWMIVPAELTEQLIARLKMFVLRDKVVITPKPEITLLGLINAQNYTGNDDIEHIPIEGNPPRQILIGEKQAIESLIKTNTLNLETNDDLWRLTDIRAGIPQVYPQTVEEFIPQMINLDLINGISFTKGCYPGQEIVARLRHRGRVKQRMLAGVVQDVKNLAPGDPVYSNQRADQKVGRIVDAVKTGDDEYTFSATAPAGGNEDETLLIGSASGAQAAYIPLAYDVPAE